MMFGSRSKSVDLIPVAGSQTSGRRGSACFKKKLLGWTESICNNGRETIETRSIFYTSDLGLQDRKSRSSVINLLSAGDISLPKFTDSKSSTDMSHSSSPSVRNFSMSSTDMDHTLATRNCSRPYNKILPRNVMSLSTLSNQTTSNMELWLSPNMKSQPSSNMESSVSPNMESLLSPLDDDTRGSQSRTGMNGPQLLVTQDHSRVHRKPKLGELSQPFQREQGDGNKGSRDVSPHPFTSKHPSTSIHSLTSSSPITSSHPLTSTHTLTSPNLLTSPPALPPFPRPLSGSVSHHCLGTKIRVIRRTIHHKFLRLRSRSVDRLRLNSEEAREVKMRPARRTVIAGGEGGKDGDCNDDAVIGKAVALVDYVPSPYDKTALSFKRGDTIELLAMNPSGLWRGRCGGRVGNFKFINVRTVLERMRWPDVNTDHFPLDWSTTRSVTNLLTAIRMEQLTSVFVLNGFDTLEDVKNLNEDDLDYLGVNDMEDREVILEAIAQLRVRMAGEGIGDTASEASETSEDFSDKLDRGSRTSCSLESDMSSKTESGFHSTDDNDYCDDNDPGENNVSELSVGLENMKMLRSDHHTNIVKRDVDSVPHSFLYRSKNLNLLSKVGRSFNEGVGKYNGDVMSVLRVTVDSQRL